MRGGVSEQDAARQGSGDSGAGQPGEAGFAAPVQQHIIKTGEVSLEVANVAQTLARVRAMAVELGGYVGGSQAGTVDETATLTLRIPALRFEDALARLQELDGKLMAEATREEDVTAQIVDLAARIENLRASEASYRELLARAERIDDVLAVQTRLDQVRGEIEQMQAQLENVTGQADLATLTVTLIPRPEPVQALTADWDPGAELESATASLVGIGQGLLNALIWLAVVWVPILLVLSLLVLLALRGLLEVRRRFPPTAVASSAGGDDAA